MPSAIHIAVVEYEPDIRQLVAGYFGGHGYRVSRLADRASLLRLTIDDPPAIVLLGLGLPWGKRLCDHASPARRVALRINDRDLAIEILTRGELDLADVKVGQAASRHLASVPGSAGIAEAVAVMRQAGVRRLLVTGREGELAGFVSVDDLLQSLADQLAGLAEALRGGILRETAERPSIPPPPPLPVFLRYRTPDFQQPISTR